MVPLTRTVPWSAKMSTRPPLVLMVPEWVTLALATLETASTTAEARMKTWPPLVVMVPLLSTLAKAAGSSSKRMLLPRGMLTASPAPSMALPPLVLMLPELDTLAPIKAT